MSSGPADHGDPAEPGHRREPADDDRDRRLLVAHLAGDRDAFAELVALTRDRLYAVALRLLRDPEDAADALQDALLQAYRAAASYRGEARVTTWLHRVVVNACLDRLRRRAARATEPLPDGPAEPVAPGDPYEQRETALEIETALAALPVDQRAALVLVDVHGLGVEEAARVLGCPVGTVKSRCARGRARLAVALGHLRNRPGRPDVPLDGAPDTGFDDTGFDDTGPAPRRPGRGGGP